MYANLPPTPEENTTSFGGKGPKLQNSHRFPLFPVKGTGSHTRIKKQEPRGCWMSKSTEKAATAKPNGPRQSCKKQNHCWPLSLPLALCVCDEIPQFRRAGAVFVGTAFGLLAPAPASSSSPPAQPRLSTDTEAGVLHGWHVEMNNGVTGGTSVWPQRIFCVLKANLSREEEEEAMLRPAKAEATTRPGSPPTLLLLRDKSPCQNKKS